jgi:hypothetical protein
MPASVAQAPGRVSGLVMIAALFLLLIGVLTAIAGAALLVGGNLIGQLGNVETGTGIFGAIGGVVAGIAVVVIAWALLEILTGLGMVLRRSWGRAFGVVVGLIGAIFTGLALVASVGSLGNVPLDNGDSTAAGAGAGLIFVVFLGYVLTVVALMRGGAHFRRG